MKNLNKKVISLLFTALLAVNVGAISAFAATGVDDGVIVFPSDTTYLTGDVNNDNTVDIRDLVRLKIYLSDNSGKTEINGGNADINGDHKIDSTDLAGLKKLLLNAK